MSETTSPSSTVNDKSVTATVGGSLLLLERKRFVTLRNSRRIAPIDQDRFSVMNLPSRAAGSACF